MFRIEALSTFSHQCSDYMRCSRHYQAALMLLLPTQVPGMSSELTAAVVCGKAVVTGGCCVVLGTAVVVLAGGVE